MFIPAELNYLCSDTFLTGFLLSKRASDSGVPRMGYDDPDSGTWVDLQMAFSTSQPLI